MFPGKECFGLSNVRDLKYNDFKVTGTATPAATTVYYFSTLQRSSKYIQWVRSSAVGDKFVALSDGIYSISAAGGVRSTSGAGAQLLATTWDYPAGLVLASWTWANSTTAGAGDASAISATVTLQKGEYVQLIDTTSGGVTATAHTYMYITPMVLF